MISLPLIRATTIFSPTVIGWGGFCPWPWPCACGWPGAAGAAAGAPGALGGAVADPSAGAGAPGPPAAVGTLSEAPAAAVLPLSDSDRDVLPRPHEMERMSDRPIRTPKAAARRGKTLMGKLLSSREKRQFTLKRRFRQRLDQACHACHPLHADHVETHAETPRSGRIEASRSGLA